MIYKSTRNPNNTLTASQAILQGLSQDGGLYVPSKIPRLANNWQELADYSYQEMAFYVLKEFLTDFSEDELRACIQAAYDDKFDTPIIAPLVKVGTNYHLELFHGPTIAFKDMALTILPYLMKTAAKINHNESKIVILTATSGDTGKAAMAGFADVEGTEIIVFYPKEGVSSIQERQMLTQEGQNTHVVAIHGNFDDAQSKVKELFNDPVLREQLADHQLQFSSANSMNIGRLFPQVVYYYYAYAQLIKAGTIQAGEKVNFSVPTGNFGNILAGYYAQQTGLPIGQLICASNDNTVLYDFFQTGTYDRNRPFELTISPSMDILVSSNLERLIYHAVGEDSEILSSLMNQLQEEGHYHLESDYQVQLHDFLAEFASQGETLQEIKEVYEESDYIMDPHTAVASKAWRKLQDREEVEANPTIIVSTASPFKFPEAILDALAVDRSSLNDKEILEKVSQLTGLDYPPAVEHLLEAPILHNRLVDVASMKDEVLDILNLSEGK
ncbi:threonine synthase [Hutsoniella sourekii]